MPGLFLWKKALTHSKEYFVSGCFKQDRMSEKRFFDTFNLEKEKWTNKSLYIYIYRERERERGRRGEVHIVSKSQLT